MIKSKILITAGMVWQARSDKWKALLACVAGESLQNKRTCGGRGEQDKCDEERSEKKERIKEFFFFSISMSFVRTFN